MKSRVGINILPVVALQNCLVYVRLQFAKVVQSFNVIVRVVKQIIEFCQSDLSILHERLPPLKEASPKALKVWVSILKKSAWKWKCLEDIPMRITHALHICLQSGFLCPRPYSVYIG